MPAAALPGCTFSEPGSADMALAATASLLVEIGAGAFAAEGGGWASDVCCFNPSADHRRVIACCDTAPFGGGAAIECRRTL
mmetsp:Transcript_70135/g.205620  ORF Transcript_70135/g.205620 Transcript_70135/m.205620 type:complete len:81 (-) Transcript_70135:186-428(-)